MTDAPADSTKPSVKSARDRYAEKQNQFAAQQGIPAVATSPVRVAPVTTRSSNIPIYSNPTRPTFTHTSPPSALRPPATTKVTIVAGLSEAKSPMEEAENGEEEDPDKLTPPSPPTTTPSSAPYDDDDDDENNGNSILFKNIKFDSPQKNGANNAVSVPTAKPPINPWVQSVEINSPWSGMESCEGWVELLGKQKVEAAVEVRGQCLKCGQMITTDQEREREPVRDELGRNFYRHLKCPVPSEVPAPSKVDIDISSLMPQLRRLGITDQAKAAAAINSAIRDLQAVQSLNSRPRPSVAAMETPSPFASPDRFLPRPAFRDLSEREQSKYSQSGEGPNDSVDSLHREDNSGLEGRSRVLSASYLDIDSALTELEPSVAAYYETSLRRLTQQRDQGEISSEEYNAQLKDVTEQVKVAQRRAKAERNRDADADARRSTISRVSMSAHESKEVRAKKEAKAERLIGELETTELTYSSSLTKLLEFVTVLKIQTREDPNFGVSASQTATLVSNVEALEEFHAKFYDYLVSRKAARISIGEVVLQLTPMASLYTEYVSNWQHQQDLLSSLRRSSPKFRAMEKTVLAKIGSPSLESFLILPVQRIPRYVMFLRELVKNTSEGADASQFSLLTEGLQKVEVVADQVNQARAKSDAEAALERLKQKARFGFPLDFTGKTLLREDLVKLKGGSINHTLGKITELRLFLFTDLLLWTSETYKFRGQTTLPEASFLLAPEADTDRVWVEARWPTGVFVFMMKKTSGGVDEKKWANDAIVAKAYRMEKYIAMSSEDFSESLAA